MYTYRSLRLVIDAESSRTHTNLLEISIEACSFPDLHLVPWSCFVVYTASNQSSGILEKFNTIRTESSARRMDSIGSPCHRLAASGAEQSRHMLYGLAESSRTRRRRFGDGMINLSASVSSFNFSRLECEATVRPKEKKF